MESILDHLKRRLRDAGHGRWEQIAEAAGVAKTLPRKVAYGDRENPGVQTIQPLLDFFAAVERGDRQLPQARKSSGDGYGQEGRPADPSDAIRPTVNASERDS